MSTATPTTTESIPRVTSRGATLLQGMAVAVLLAMIGWVAVQVFVTDGTIPAPSTGGSQVDEAAETARVVTLGLVPAATLRPAGGHAAETARLVDRGLVPAATLQPTRGQTADTARLEAQAAATLQPTRGQSADTARLEAQRPAPAETHRPKGEEAVTRSLIDRGLVPGGTQE